MNLKAEKYKIDASTDVTTTFKTHLLFPIFRI